MVSTSSSKKTSTKLNVLPENLKACNRCTFESNKNCNKFYVEQVIRKNQILFVDLATSFVQFHTLSLSGDKEVKFLTEYLEGNYFLSRKDWVLFHLVRCSQPEYNKKELTKAAKNCVDHMVKLIETIKPKAIICIDDTVYKTLSKAKIECYCLPPVDSLMYSSSALPAARWNNILKKVTSNA